MFGVDVFENCVADMNQKKIWEPVVNKQAQCMYVDTRHLIFFITLSSMISWLL